ncbi:C4-dicarboxylate TRAP transporter substrate-binding protein [Sulfitobacter sp. F26169L]|uniref:C4-dicarboxylate TRAP transporter substrate-binding protein n=1 Tax=Sulfitobacter sp. F26169L TaxID=2996015 RepID=UPI002260C694|nr:C4-dicarboxylate TRAP transporter substrate-binding protein [Sulfitobacter sp. F26169L]MCX7567987.1 C4-dicarboxylate TRAP transporter substrate-binding protein [Sulfitobacter sp. F26169L]
MKSTIKGMLAGAAIMALATGAQAQELRFAGGWPPGSQPTKMVENYAKTLEEYSDGEVTMRVFPLSLLSFAEGHAGVRDGIADMTALLTAYFPSEYPTLNMLAEFSELVELEQFASETSSVAFAGAISEYVLLNCEECQEEVEKQNHVYLGAGSTTTYVLQCMEPLTSVEDLKGKRIRTAGAYWARWAEEVGATPVSMSINETLEGLNQGVVDCSASNTADFVNFGFIDVVKYVYVGLPGALFNFPITINKDSWNSLSDNGKNALLRAQAKLLGDITFAYILEGRDGKERSPALGIEYTAAADDMIAMNRDFINKDKEAIASIYKERFGIESGAQAAEALEELLVKWTDLTKDVEDGAALEKIYYDEIFSKVDIATYGK